MPERNAANQYLESSVKDVYTAGDVAVPAYKSKGYISDIYLMPYTENTLLYGWTAK